LAILVFSFAPATFHCTKSTAAAMFFVCFEMIHGPPPTCPVTTGSVPQRSGVDVVHSPAGSFSVSRKTASAYHAAPGIIRTLSASPPYCLAKSGENTVMSDTDLLAMSGSSRFAMRVQCASAALIRTVLGPFSVDSGHWSDHR